MGKIKKMFLLIKKYKSIKTIVNFYFEGYLAEIGWIASYEKKMPLGLNGEEFPWITYSAIEFLREKLSIEMDIFEYGSGNSTIYYSKRVNSVTAIEHDKDWYKKIKVNLQSNVNLVYKRLEYNGEYCRAIEEFDKKFDIVIVDGRDRVNCVKNSVARIKENGVIILDDSERKEYLDGQLFLMNNGFNMIEFWGIAPGIFYNKCTTVFYRKENCFNI